MAISFSEEDIGRRCAWQDGMYTTRQGESLPRTGTGILVGVNKAGRPRVLVKTVNWNGISCWVNHEMILAEILELGTRLKKCTTGGFADRGGGYTMMGSTAVAIGCYEKDCECREKEDQRVFTGTWSLNPEAENRCDEYFNRLRNPLSKRIMMNVSAWAKKLLDANTKTQLKAEYRNEDLSLTERGKRELLAILADKYSKELTEAAQEDLDAMCPKKD